MTTVAFGELMMRLSPETYNRFAQTDRFAVTFGGAEANVAADLALWGENARFISAFPSHEIGELALASLRTCGVDVSFVVRGGERLGVYFTEKGISARGGKVIYDRKDSAFALADKDAYDWDGAFTGADWLHITGITPALSSEAAESALEAVKRAKARGLTVSFDPNYRSTLWTKAEAAPVLRKMTEYADVLITNEGQAEDVYGLRGDLRETAANLAEKYGCGYVAMTERTCYSAARNDFSAALFRDGRVYESRVYPLEIADRLGGGDAFAAGLIYALKKGFEPSRAVEFAAAAGALKHTVEGDYAFLSVAEIEALAQGDASGRVIR